MLYSASITGRRQRRDPCTADLFQDLTVQDRKSLCLGLRFVQRHDEANGRG
jgi:hypothetical protein